MTNEMLNNYESAIRQYLADNRIYHEVYADYHHNAVCVEISWGDWKHDHARTDWLVLECFEDIKTSYTKITEEDGSDTYSAIHYYVF